MAKTVFDVLNEKLTEHQSSSEEFLHCRVAELKTLPGIGRCVASFGV
jgi:hypothetical protein